jgi:hypothetical protein
MERLIDNIYSFKDKVEECENAYLLAVQKKLKEYEDLEEQGRLIKLSCKVGDTVYYINPDKNTINELVVYGFDIRPLQRFVYDYMGARLNFNQFGKTVFLTKAEAEAKLEELRGGE